jgi:zinc D-Ala-D-Ala dipeptidase
MKKNILFVIIFCGLLYSQQIEYNKYGLQVVDNPEIYGILIESDSTKLLVDLEDYIPGVKLDILYATADNFYKEPVYPRGKAFLRLPAAEALKNVQNELARQNKSLKIFDAYRPYGVTLLFYEKIKDTNFVASAWTGSRHNRGCAVDLTIIDLDTGEELKMPTEYDDFTERAAIDYMDIPDNEKQNRNLLQSLMQKYGFSPVKSEWWHFDYHDWKKFEITDISFDELEKIYLSFKEINEYVR